MNRIAVIASGIAASAIVLGTAGAAQAAGPVAPPPAAAAQTSTPVVEVYVGGYYGYPYHRYYRPYGWRPWYYYGGPPIVYEAPPPVVYAQPPQPVWTGAGVVWLFPGAPQ
ncbi:MAG: hypothetical protein IT563_13475 [Alphaproteobacteria bacterium]|nr:hypothetical protein [Alphaproteobacteria bacterium]